MTEQRDRHLRPWIYGAGEMGTFIFDAGGCTVAELATDNAEGDQNEADARLIVEAVNAHAALRAVAEYVAGMSTSPDAFCHIGLTTQEACCRCKWILLAQRALGKGEKR